MPAGVSAASRKRSSASSSTSIDVRTVRPVGMSDAVRHRRRRVHEEPPRALAGARAPRERRVLVGKAGVDAERVGDARVNELAALVERTEFLAEAVHGLARRERQRGGPMSALAHAAERRQPGEAAEVLVGDGAGDRRAAMKEAKAQRRGGDLERALARRERPGAAFPGRHRARLGPAEDEAIVGPGARSHAQPEHARAVAGDFEDVAGRRRERRARRRRAETLQRVEPDEGGGVESHARRGYVGRMRLNRRTWVRAGPARRPASRRCRRTAEGARAPPRRAFAAPR